jgi:hypothetical protein
LAKAASDAARTAVRVQATPDRHELRFSEPH